jgi:hypothetical protein
MKDRGCELVLFFSDGSGDGPVLEMRLLPDSETLEPRTLRQFAPQAPLYASYARAAMQFRHDEAGSALMALRQVGATRRGLGNEFYKVIARSYAALVDEGERYPVKALAEQNHVVISTASRWIKEARRRGYITEAVNA